MAFVLSTEVFMMLFSDGSCAGMVVVALDILSLRLCTGLSLLFDMV